MSITVRTDITSIAPTGLLAPILTVFWDIRLMQAFVRWLLILSTLSKVLMFLRQKSADLTSFAMIRIAAFGTIRISQTDSLLIRLFPNFIRLTRIIRITMHTYADITRHATTRIVHFLIRLTILHAKKLSKSLKTLTQAVAISARVTLFATTNIVTLLTMLIWICAKLSSTSLTTIKRITV
jgi:hypothetical protein